MLYINMVVTYACALIVYVCICWCVCVWFAASPVYFCVRPRLLHKWVFHLLDSLMFVLADLWCTWFNGRLSFIAYWVFSLTQYGLLEAFWVYAFMCLDSYI